MRRTEYDRLLQKERDYQDRLGKAVGIPFAIVAVPSWALGIVLLPVLGMMSVLVAAPGVIALVIAASAFWILGSRSEKREMALKRKFDYGRSRELAD